MEALMLIRPQGGRTSSPDSFLPILVYGLTRAGVFVQKTVTPADRNTANSFITDHIRVNPACTNIDNVRRQWTLVTIRTQEVTPDAEMIDKTASVVRTIRRQMKEERERRDAVDRFTGENVVRNAL